FHHYSKYLSQLFEFVDKSHAPLFWVNKHGFETASWYVPLSCAVQMSVQNCNFGVERLSLKSSHRETAGGLQISGLGLWLKTSAAHTSLAELAACSPKRVELQCSDCAGLGKRISIEEQWKLVYVSLSANIPMCLYDECYNVSWSISKMGWVEDRAPIQAWEDTHVEVPCLFFFPPDIHGLTSNFLFLQLLFCFLAKDNSGGGALVTGKGSGEGTQLGVASPFCGKRHLKGKLPHINALPMEDRISSSSDADYLEELGKKDKGWMGPRSSFLSYLLLKYLAAFLLTFQEQQGQTLFLSVFGCCR
ncbi:unnamed protein product, partial [Bubo scandiacus]